MIVEGGIAGNVNQPRADIWGMPVPPRIAYKVMSTAEAAAMHRDGVFPGSPVDITDGFIHLSCASQLSETLDRHFSGATGLMLAAVDLARLGDAVRWEVSRSGQIFPHLYGTLPTDALVAIVPLERSSDGVVRLPVECPGWR